MMVEITEDHLNILKEVRDLVSKQDIVINGDIIIEDNAGDTKKSVQKLRNTPGANSWKNKVKQRDKVCQCCGASDHLEVHHVFPLSVYPAFATDITNGIVLCQTCHRDYHKEWRGSEGSATLVKFIKEHGRFL